METIMVMGLRIKVERLEATTANIKVIEEKRWRIKRLASKNADRLFALSKRLLEECGGKASITVNEFFRSCYLQGNGLTYSVGANDFGNSTIAYQVFNNENRILRDCKRCSAVDQFLDMLIVNWLRCFCTASAGNIANFTINERVYRYRTVWCNSVNEYVWEKMFWQGDVGYKIII